MVKITASCIGNFASTAAKLDEYCRFFTSGEVLSLRLFLMHHPLDQLMQQNTIHLTRRHGPRRRTRQVLGLNEKILLEKHKTHNREKVDQNYG